MKRRLLVGVTTSVLGLIGAGVWKGLKKLDAQTPFTDVYTTYFPHDDALEYVIIKGKTETYVEGEALQQILDTTMRMTLEEKARAVNGRAEVLLYSLKGTVVYVTVASPTTLAINGVTYDVHNGDSFYHTVMAYAQ